MSIKLSPLFSDHAVLQRGMPIPVWGWAASGALVKVELAGREAVNKTGADGNFTVELPPAKAGGPYQLRVSSGDCSLLVEDVWVGEVWLASGQSNMEWTINMLGDEARRGVVEDGLGDIRMITVDKVAKIGGRAGFKGAWTIAAPDTVGNFSAVGYHFAARLRRELGVAVGIVNSSWGGTVAEAWTSRETLVRNPDYAAAVHHYHSLVNSSSHWLGDGNDVKTELPTDPGNTRLADGWASASFDDGGWEEMSLPKAWQAAGHNYSGVFWFRQALEVPAEWAGRDLLLKIGAVDKHDTTYFNGEEVGSTGKGFESEHWNAPRTYRVPGRLVKAGQNLVAARVYSFLYHGGLIGPESAMRLEPADDAGGALPLTGIWKYAVEHNFGMVAPPGVLPGEDNPNSPHILYDNMIRPLLPFAIRGVVWYQGESNANRGTAEYYRRLLTDLVGCWRHAWGQGDFPFIVTQLANYKTAADYQEGSDWALLREAQLRILEEPLTGLAVIIDVGEADDIHPKNKRAVGERLAQWALANSYGKPLVPSGPLYERMTIEGDSLRIHFRHADGGLVAENGPLKTFMAAGADRKFVPAEAFIDGDTLIVRSIGICRPVAVRYAWADNPEGCNLHNAAGLPASPFRTDTWI